MKLTHFLKEATGAASQYPTVTEADVIKLCEIKKGQFTIDDNVVNINTDVMLSEREAARYKNELPFKFGTINGSFDASTASFIKSLNNFPDLIHGTLNISNNTDITSLATGQHILCQTLDAEGCANIKDLHGCPEASAYIFRYCVNLTTTAGLNTDNLAHIDLRGCSRLRDISNLTKHGVAGNSFDYSKDPNQISWNPHLPLISLILNGTASDASLARLPFNIAIIDNEDKSRQERLKIIYKKFKGKGLAHAIELANELQTQGFLSNCKF